LRSGISAIGTSKHQAKAEARAMGAVSWHDIGKQLGIHSYSTERAYTDVWAQVLAYGKSLPRGERIREMEQIDQRIVTGYLSEKIQKGVSHNTFNQYTAAVEKLETALNLYSQRYHADDGRGRTYQFDLSAVREQARDLSRPGPDFSRSYDRPKELIAALRSEVHRIAASVQYEGGARLREINGLRAENLKGNNMIHLTHTKGGRERDIHVKPETYRALEKHIAEHGGRFMFSKDAYRRDLRHGAEETDQEYQSTHGLRWNFAQAEMERLQVEEHRSYDESLQIVAEELGHNREDITRHYLR